MAAAAAAPERLGLDFWGVLCVTDNNNMKRRTAVEGILNTSPTHECLEAVRALVNHFGPDNVFVVTKLGSDAMLECVAMWFEMYGVYDKTGLLPGNVVAVKLRTGMEHPPRGEPFLTADREPVKFTGTVQQLELAGLAPPDMNMHDVMAKANQRIEADGGPHLTTGMRVRAGKAVEEIPVGKGVPAALLGLTHFVDDRLECLQSVLAGTVHVDRPPVRLMLFGDHPQGLPNKPTAAARKHFGAFDLDALWATHRLVMRKTATWDEVLQQCGVKVE